MKYSLWLAVFAFLVSFAPGVIAEQPTFSPAMRAVFESDRPAVPTSEIDRLVFRSLSELGIEPVICSDCVFIRRAYLDTIGCLPTAAEVRAFLSDTDTKTKRVRLIDQLLERDEFADYWSMKWGDTLRIKAEFPINLWPNAAQAYHHWVRDSIAQNKPYDQFARELLTSSGSNFRAPEVNFYRAVQNKTPEGIANAVALTFMGCRSDSWSPTKLEGMAAFFSQIGYKPTAEWKEEIVFWDPLHQSVDASNVAPGSAVPGKVAASPETDGSLPSIVRPTVATFPDGKTVKLTTEADPRIAFAAWLIRDDNPYFARSAVNRVWAWLLGRGLVEPADDFRADNPPIHPELLAYLESEFVKSHYDLKSLYRLILTSEVYQFSSLSNAASTDGESRSVAELANYPLRRLDAEVLIDAINQITGSNDLYTSAIPEPFTYIPRGQPAVSIADGSITSPFLALFGRSARATGMADERSNNPVPAQWLHLLNSSHIQQKLERGQKLKRFFAANRKPQQTIDELYLTILSRHPSESEISIVMAYPNNRGRFRREDWIDICWALINSTEFSYKH
ncbi:hypothetical protein Q31b_00380 [Novipirellula aureliae]|uniref:DUF1553 domain-containing protein n=1 Tax=Novipirellula aureliae TaxID=2527966 RepID=A0A5C6E7T5_9BACT|nr:DUF1553 domain-containing protein [Novipirellula aureliae]TWU44868.1 hypothetical protein Q31b_00380 [Novipirellula aureliae]